MRHEGSGWDRSFFWQFVNGTHGSPDCLKRVVTLERKFAKIMVARHI